jgi:hypothetical protein
MIDALAYLRTKAALIEAYSPNEAYSLRSVADAIEGLRPSPLDAHIRAAIAPAAAGLDACDWTYVPMLGFYCETHCLPSYTNPPQHAATRPAEDAGKRP